MERLKQCYETYIEEAEKVWLNRPVLDGVFGLRSATKDHPCHLQFFEALEAWVEAFVKSNPEPQLAEEAVTYIVEAAEPYKNKFPYWALYASHGQAKALIPFVSPRYAAEKRAWYEVHCPRRERLPVHRDLYKLLKKRERE